MYLDDNVQQALRQMNKIAVNEVLKKEADNIPYLKERDFKIFNENKGKFKSIENEKSYWKLLK